VPQPVTIPLTRRSGWGAKGWLLPVAVLVPALAMAALAVQETDRLYVQGAGVLDARQIVPYGLDLRHAVVEVARELPPTDDAAVEDEWLQHAAAAAQVDVPTAGRLHDAAVRSWRHETGATVIVVAVRTDDPEGFTTRITSLAPTAIRAWPEGDGLAVALVVSANNGEDVVELLNEAEPAVRSSMTVLRAAALPLGAIGPVVAVLGVGSVALLAVFAAFAVVGIVIVLVLLVLIALRIGYTLLTGHGRRSGGHQAAAPQHDRGENVVRLQSQARSSSAGVLRVLPLVAIALPAATRSLWPGSLIWAAVLGLVYVLALGWANESTVARLFRWLLYAALAVGLSHALVDWPAFDLPSDRTAFTVVGALAAAVCLLIIVRHRRSKLQSVGLSVLGARWLVMAAGLVILAAASAAVFLGSNGDPELRTNLGAKALALPGLVAVPLAARRMRAARTAAQVERLRRLDRPDVLYLRSFADDGLRVRSTRKAREGLERLMLWPTELFEDVLIRGLLKIGPVIAIGRPGTDQTELGAARDLVIGDDWVRAVTTEMDDSKMIVVVLGRGKGLATELRALSEGNRLSRACIVVPPVPGEEAAARLAMGTEALGGQGWGLIDSDTVDGSGEIVALLGVGGQRLIVVADRRKQALTYISLGEFIAEAAAGLRTVPTSSPPDG
jgi:hypothetical protein